MREQAQIAIDTADVIIFITDVRQGLVDSDAKVADMLRRSGKPVRLVVNKVDSHQKYMMDVYEFYNLGIGEPIPISAANRQGLGDMLDEVIKEFPDKSEEEDQDDIPKIAIVGKPNVGKSSLINKLLGEERVIVSNIAGTTRDAIDTKVTWNKKDYIFIDTAGLRRKGKVKEEIERYSVIRTVTAVERADVVVVVIDASEGVTEQDAKIAGIAHDRGKGIIVAVNKWDAIEKNDKTIYKHTERSVRSFPLCHMHRSSLSLQKQVRDFQSFSKISIQLSKIRHFVSRQVFLMRSFLRQSLFSSRRLTEEED